MNLPRAHLPEGQEHNCLHQDELQQWIEWLKQLTGANPEQHQPVQCKRVAHIVQDGDVEVPAWQQKVTGVAATLTNIASCFAQHVLDTEVQGALQCADAAMSVQNGGQRRWHGMRWLAVSDMQAGICWLHLHHAVAAAKQMPQLLIKS
jgi:hypothetical protein